MSSVHPMTQAEARDRFVRETLASTVTTLGLVTAILDTGDGRTPIGGYPTVFTVDARTNAVALSSLDAHGRVKPLGLWRLSELYDVAFAQQQAQDDAEDAEADGDVPPPCQPAPNLWVISGRNPVSSRTHTETKPEHSGPRE